VILQIWGPGQLLCASGFCGAGEHCCSTLALDDEVDIATLKRRDLLELLGRSPSASQAFLQEVTGREVDFSRRIEELSSGQVERRLATLLLRFADQIGRAEADGTVSIPIRLSRQELADLSGTTLRTAIRVMSRLAKGCVVRTEAAGFRVLSRPGLEEIARGETAR
jgi:CRP/FNR family transcriptional regulator, nitrogen oxide reductase regulator